MTESKDIKNGFAVLVLDIIFVAIGLFLLITGLVSHKDILSAILSR